MEGGPRSLYCWGRAPLRPVWFAGALTFLGLPGMFRADLMLSRDEAWSRENVHIGVNQANANSAIPIAEWVLGLKTYF
jgi:hypothetical protein